MIDLNQCWNLIKKFCTPLPLPNWRFRPHKILILDKFQTNTFINRFISYQSKLTIFEILEKRLDRCSLLIFKEIDSSKILTECLHHGRIKILRLKIALWKKLRIWKDFTMIYFNFYHANRNSAFWKFSTPQDKEFQ